MRNWQRKGVGWTTHSSLSRRDGRKRGGGYLLTEIPFDTFTLRHSFQLSRDTLSVMQCMKESSTLRIGPKGDKPRRLMIRKMRGTRHSKTYHNVIITDRCLKIMPFGYRRLRYCSHNSDQCHLSPFKIVSSGVVARSAVIPEMRNTGVNPSS